MPTRWSFAVLPLFIAAPAIAQSPFDGTWKANLSSLAAGGKPDDWTIRNGTFSCASCIPAYSVAADGAYHAVKGKDYWDETAVTVVDDHTAKFSYRKAGKVIGENTQTVSADGMTMTVTSRGTANATGTPIDSTSIETRVGAPVAGAHILSGQWKWAPPTSISDTAMTMTMQVSGDTLHLKAGTGEVLDAKIGGPYALTQGDPGKTMTKVERLGPRALKLTDMRGGKVVQVSTYTVGDDGMLKGSWSDPRNGDSGSWMATRQ